MTSFHDPECVCGVFAVARFSSKKQSVILISSGLCFPEEELRKLREETNVDSLRQELDRERSKRIDLEQKMNEVLKTRWDKPRQPHSHMGDRSWARGSNGSVACFNGDASHLLWMGWSHALPNCIVVPSHFTSVACFESWEKFNFLSVDGSTSQSNHTPVQALANQNVCLCVRGGRLMWLVLVARQTRPPASFNATLPCGRTVIVRESWEMGKQHFAILSTQFTTGQVGWHVCVSPISSVCGEFLKEVCVFGQEEKPKRSHALVCVSPCSHCDAVAMPVSGKAWASWHPASQP